MTATRPPFCVLMVGLPGSGKTTLSRVLTGRGFVRLCPDEEMYRRHGVYGVDFPRGTFPTLERPVLEDMAVELREQLKAGHDVVVDHGFWTRRTEPDGKASPLMPAPSPCSFTSRSATMSCGQGSASATTSTKAIRTPSISRRAT